MRLVFKGLCQRVDFAEKSGHLLREVVVVPVLGFGQRQQSLALRIVLRIFSLMSAGSSRSDRTMESRDPMVCMSPSINDELLMLNDELDVIIVFQYLRFHLFNFNTC